MDKKITKSAHVLMSAALLALGLSAVSVKAQQVVGINAAIKNKVQTRKVNSQKLQPAKLKGRVSIGDYIITGKTGVLQILLRDRTSFTVGKNGQMTIDRFVYDPANNASEVAATVTKGAFRFMSGKPMRNRKGASTIKTPVGTIGIRGTILEGAIGQLAIETARREAVSEEILKTADDNATFIVLRGPGFGAQDGEAAGAIDLRMESGVFSLEKAGEAYFIPRQGARPIGPFRFSNIGFEQTLDWMGTQPPTRPQIDRREPRGGPRDRRRPNRPAGPPPINRTFEVEQPDNDAGAAGP